MYRLKPGTRNKFAYYRCYGRGTQRKGCGNVIPVPTLDGLVGLCMRAHGKNLEIKDLVLVPGDDHAAELEEIRFEIRSLASQI